MNMYEVMIQEYRSQMVGNENRLEEFSSMKEYENGILNARIEY
jgi:hypothetical protein